jgi:hypothetical protein
MKEQLIYENTVLSLADKIYADSVKEFGYSNNTDMSHSDKCHTLTQDLMTGLQEMEIPVRRELHVDEYGNWHYIIAHSTENATDFDTITDMNPWFSTGVTDRSGLLHGQRLEVMDTLLQVGLHPTFVALRSLTTIVIPHTENLLTEYTHPPLSLPKS